MYLINIQVASSVSLRLLVPCGFATSTYCIRAQTVSTSVQNNGGDWTSVTVSTETAADKTPVCPGRWWGRKCSMTSVSNSEPEDEVQLLSAWAASHCTHQVQILTAGSEYRIMFTAQKQYKNLPCSVREATQHSSKWKCFYIKTAFPVSELQTSVPLWPGFLL